MARKSAISRAYRQGWICTMYMQGRIAQTARNGVAGYI